MDSAPGPGTAAYFPSLLTRIHEAHPDLPVDPVIVQSLLLCLVAGDGGANSHISSHSSKNLVLRTREEDIGLVLYLTELILTKVFGFPAHKRKLKHSAEVTQKSGEPSTVPHEPPDEFLRDLFFRGKHNPRFSSGSRRRSTRGPLRSSSFPPPSPLVADNTQLPSSNSHSREGTEESEFDVTSLGSSRRILITPASTLRIRPQAPRTVTEPPPETAVTVSSRFTLAGRSPKSTSRRLDFNTNLPLPKALVISGLEYAGTPAQRALLRTLQDRRLELDAYEADDGIGRTWNLPDDFIIVYVCTIDQQGRPPGLATLLDRFAMSVDVVVSPSVRQAYVSYRSVSASPLSSSFLSTTPRTPLSPLRPLDEPLAHSPSPLLRATSQAATGSTMAQSLSPVISPHEIAYLRSLTSQAPAAIPAPYQIDADSLPDAYTSIHPSLRLYLADLFAATRHHPLLDGTMLTLRAHRDAEDLARAFRVISGSTLGAELVVEVAAMNADGQRSVDIDTEASGGLETPDDDSSLEWGKAPSPEAEPEAWLGDELRMSKRKAASVRSVEVRVQSPHSEDFRAGAGAPFGDASSSVNNLHTGLSSPVTRAPQIWDVSEVDIARIFPRVVSHRVRMRSGPDDEILGGVMFPAVPAAIPDINGKRDEHFNGSEQTVKQVLISVLADV